MIFCFSATGNSSHIAKGLLKNSERLVSVSEALREKEFIFNINDDSVGFIFPVYFMGIPNALSSFLSNAKIKIKKDAYVYIVMTCGSITGNAQGIAKKLLSSRGIQINAVFSVKMVDTYVPLFKIPDKSRQAQINLCAEKELDEIRKKIENRVEGDNNPHKGIFPKTVTFFSYALYKRSRSTKKFHVEDSCIGCGFCEKICPEQAINIKNGKPIWIKPQCSLCLGCLHRCPKESIQYGNKSKNSGRFYYKDS